jgi:hypothetical protein
VHEVRVERVGLFQQAVTGHKERTTDA